MGINGKQYEDDSYACMICDPRNPEPPRTMILSFFGIIFWLPVVLK